MSFMREMGQVKSLLQGLSNLKHPTEQQAETIRALRNRYSVLKNERHGYIVEALIKDEAATGRKAYFHEDKWYEAGNGGKDWL